MHVWLITCSISIHMKHTIIIIFKPQRMREGYGSRVCVCVCVCYLASGYIPGLYIESEAAYSFLWTFKDMCCVDFAENVSFGRYGTICLPQ